MTQLILDAQPIITPLDSEHLDWWLSLSPETRAILRQCTKWQDIPLPPATIGVADDTEPFDYADAVARHGRMATR